MAEGKSLCRVSACTQTNIDHAKKACSWPRRAGAATPSPTVQERQELRRRPGTGVGSPYDRHERSRGRKPHYWAGTCCPLGTGGRGSGVRRGVRLREKKPRQSHPDNLRSAVSSDRSVPYDQLPALEHVYLEDGWVLDIQVTYRTVTFVLDLVVTNDHRLYTPPPAHEAYCYRKTNLIFNDVSDVRWSNTGLRPAVDVTGTEDFGGIDFLNKQDDRFVLGGDWGRMRIDSANPTLVFLPENGLRGSGGRSWTPNRGPR